MSPEVQFRLDGKVAIVTGGAGAIGRVVARGLAEAGASVVLASRNAESAEEAAQKLRRTDSPPSRSRWTYLIEHQRWQWLIRPTPSSDRSTS